MKYSSSTLSDSNRAFALQGILLFAVITAVAGDACASQPPDPVHSDKGADTAMGTDALQGLTSGYQNTASGESALQYNQNGYKNTASGYSALQHNVGGFDNAAFGSGALDVSVSGDDNAAFGMDALYNSAGSNNTAVGSHAAFNGGGGDSVALGMNALYSTESGQFNVAVGEDALYANLYGAENVAVGFDALAEEAASSENTAIGTYAMLVTSFGQENTAIGWSALDGNTTGSNNIAVGYTAGFALTTGSNNIDIGAPGIASESGKIRIGVQGTQKSAFIAGINSSQVTGAAVYINSSGQLGVLASSERYKTDIASMAGRTDKLRALRPVSFHLKTDPQGVVQYGLIAEEVDKVYPELVIRDDKGVVQGVRYDELAPMLLNVLLKDEEKIAASDLAIKRQTEDVAAMKATIAAQAKQLSAVGTEAREAIARTAATQESLTEVLNSNRQIQLTLKQLKARYEIVAME